MKAAKWGHCWAGSKVGCLVEKSVGQMEARWVASTAGPTAWTSVAWRAVLKAAWLAV